MLNWTLSLITIYGQELYFCVIDSDPLWSPPSCLFLNNMLGILLSERLKYFSSPKVSLNWFSIWVSFLFKSSPIYLNTFKLKTWSFVFFWNDSCLVSKKIPLSIFNGFTSNLSSPNLMIIKYHLRSADYFLCLKIFVLVDCYHLDSW